MSQVCKFVWILMLIGFPSTLMGQTEHDPIYIHMVIHIEDLGMPRNFGFERKAQNLYWLVNYLDSLPEGYRPLPIIEIQGDVAETAVVNDPNGELFREMLTMAYALGLVFGVHAHCIYREGDMNWVIVNLPTPSDPCSPADSYAFYIHDSSLVVNGLNGHIFWVDSLLTHSLGFHPSESLVPAYSGAYAPAPQQRWRVMAGNLHDSLGNQLVRGFTIGTNHPGEECFYSWFDHSIWNPFRPGTLGILDEDLGQRFYVRVPTAEVIGGTAEHFRIWQDNTVEARQKDFIMLLLNRKFIKHAGLVDKVWCIGVTMHPYNLEPPDSNGYELEQRRDELKRFIDWLNAHFVGKTDIRGDTIAKWATVSHIYERFLLWEANHPGVSSFEYMPIGFDLDAYPYPLKGLVKFLHNTHFNSFIVENDTMLVVKFDACPSTIRGDPLQGYWVRDNLPINGRSYCRDAPQQSGTLLQTYPIYVLFSEIPDSVDFYALTDETDSFGFISALDGHRIYENGHNLPVMSPPIIAMPARYISVSENDRRTQQPFCAKLTLNFQSPNSLLIFSPRKDFADISIFDASGRKVSQIKEVKLDTGENVIRMDWRPRSGVYFIRVSTSSQKSFTKFLVLR